MSYKIARDRVPTGRSKDSHKTASRPADPNQPPNQPAATKPHPAGPIQGPPQTPRHKKNRTPGPTASARR